jgi:pimeloyl-ACP methyl ester carboxylesterase
MVFPPYHPFRSPEAKKQYLSFYDRRSEIWPLASENRVVKTSYGSTFVRVSGPAQALPLVLLPGAASTSLAWAPNIAAWSEAYRTYAVDNIYDYGRSVNKRPMRRPDDFMTWLDELFTALGFDCGIRLLGLSYGGWLTAMYAITKPERLVKIVMIAPAATVKPVSLGFVLRALVDLLPKSRFSRNFVFWLLEDLAKKDEAGRRFVEDNAAEMQLAARCYKSRLPVNATVLDDQELSSIQIPALYMVGEHEKIYNPHRALRRLHRVAPHIKTELVPGAGHDLTLVQTELVNRKLLEFLQES